MAVGVLTGHRVLFFEVANEDAGHTVSEAEGHHLYRDTLIPGMLWKGAELMVP